MKALLITAGALIFMVLLSLGTNTSEIEEVVKHQMLNSKKLTDSALLELKYIHEKNDSLLDKYFPKK